LAFAFVTLVLMAGLASCSNPDQRPMDGVFTPFQDPLPKSPVGFIVSDPVFRSRQPDALIKEYYDAAALTPLTTDDLWGYFTGASSRIDMVSTRITNPDMAARLVSIANNGVQINIVAEQGFFGNSESAPIISQLSQTGHVTIKTDKDGEARQVHSAYAIIDDHIVLASSGDFLDSSFNYSVNDILVFNTPRTYVNGTGAAGVQTITDAFLFDFDQMFNQGRFGGDKEIMGNNSFNIGSQVEIYFGPNDNLLAQIANQINNAQVSVTYMVAQVTDSTMHFMMRDIANYGIYDGPSNRPGFQDPDDDANYLPTGLPYNWAGYNALNHKILVIDVPVDFSNRINPVALDFYDPVIVAGSCNWTQNGLTLNDEQLIVLHDLTLGYEIGAVELDAVRRSAEGVGVVFGRTRTFKNVPIVDVTVSVSSLEIPASPFLGDGGNPTSTQSVGTGIYYMEVPSGRLKNLQIEDLAEAADSYLYPDPLFAEDLPNDYYNLLPGASYEANFYCNPAPSQTGTGTGT
jgi:hypothetical protein